MTGPAWRIAPCGTTQVYVVRVHADGTADVCSRVGRGWANKPMRVAAIDVFPDRSSARAEYRKRRAAADVSAGLNFATSITAAFLLVLGMATAAHAQQSQLQPVKVAPAPAVPDPLSDVMREASEAAERQVAFASAFCAGVRGGGMMDPAQAIDVVLPSREFRCAPLEPGRGLPPARLVIHETKAGAP